MHILFLCPSFASSYPHQLCGSSILTLSFRVGLLLWSLLTPAKARHCLILLSSLLMAIKNRKLLLLHALKVVGTTRTYKYKRKFQRYRNIQTNENWGDCMNYLRNHVAQGWRLGWMEDRKIGHKFFLFMHSYSVYHVIWPLLRIQFLHLLNSAWLCDMLWPMGHQQIWYKHKLDAEAWRALFWTCLSCWCLNPVTATWRRLGWLTGEQEGICSRMKSSHLSQLAP